MHFAEVLYAGALKKSNGGHAQRSGGCLQFFCARGMQRWRKRALRWSETAHDKRQREAGGKINKETFESRKKD